MTKPLKNSIVLNFSPIILMGTFLISVVTGCAVDDGGRFEGTQVPTLANGFSGALFVERFTQYQEIITKMQERCSDYGGLDHNSIVVVRLSVITAEKLYQYKCLKAKNTVR